MTGYSTPDYGPAALHPDGCTCGACVDCAIVEEDSDALQQAASGRVGWIEARREDEMLIAEESANCLIAEMEKWADQYEDYRAFLSMRGDLAL